MATIVTVDGSRVRRLSPWGEFLRTDFVASIIVFLVALPLCLGIAEACQVPPALGLMTGIIGGIIVGVLAGSPLQVSGPAAGLIVLTRSAIEPFRSADDPTRALAALGLVVLIAGIIQIGAGLLRLGQWFRAVAPAVIEGMLAGIGVLIVCSQFHILLDLQSHGSGISDLLKIPESLAQALVLGSQPNRALLIGLLSLAIILGWRSLVPKSWQIVPAQLLAVVVGTVAAAMLGWNLAAEGGETLVRVVRLPDRLWDAVTLPSAVSVQLLADPTIWKWGVTIALVANAETLLCATAVDQMHGGPRTRYNRELTAQGIGNTLCGFLGALPMTGVIVRSAANVTAGAKTRASAILHGVWLLLFVSALPDLLRLIPTSCLAAILVYTGIKLVNFHHAHKLYRFSRGEFLIYLLTLITIVTTDLLTGVITGIVLSAVKLVYTFSHLHIALESRPGSPGVVLRLEGAATFLRLPNLAAALEQIPPNAELHIDFEGLTYIDHACLELLINWEKQHQATGGVLVIDWGKLHARFRQPVFAERPREAADPGAAI